MTKMTIGAGFSELWAFVGANWQRMLLYLGAAVVLCGVLGFLFLRGAMTTMMLAADNPAAILGAMGSIFLFAIVAGTILMAASLLIWRSGLLGSSATPDIGWALGGGAAYMFAMIIAYLGVTILMYIVLAIFGIFAFAVLGASGLSLEALASGTMSGGVMLFVFLIYLAFLLFFTWFFGRIMVAGPVMALRRSMNPFSAISESWRLTGPSQWTIMGLYILFTIATAIYAFVMVLGFGAMFGGDGSGGIVAGVVILLFVYVPIILLSVALPAAIYRCIGGTGDSTIFE